MSKTTKADAPLATTAGAQVETNRADIARLINRGTVGTPIAGPIPADAPEHAHDAALSALFANFQPGRFREALDAIAALGDYLEVRLGWYERLVEEMLKAHPRRENERRAFEVCLAALWPAQQIGARPILDRFYRRIQEVRPADDEWYGHAARMLASDAARPGGKLEAIGECLDYSGLPDDLQEALAAQAVLNTYEPGEYLCAEGNPGDRAFFIKSGRVAILNNVGEVEKFILFRHPREVIGDMALLAPDSRRTASCRATEPTAVWEVYYEDQKEQVRDDNGDPLYDEKKKPILRVVHRGLKTLLRENQALRDWFESLYHLRRIQTRTAQHPLLRHLDIAARSRLVDLADRAPDAPRLVEKGRALAEPGQKIDHVLLLLDGTLRVTARYGPEFHSEDRQTTPTRPVLLGLEALEGDAWWPGHVLAAEQCWVTRFPVAGLREFFGGRKG